MSEDSIASGLIRLFTEFPCAGTNDPNLEIRMPAELSEASYKLIIDHLEFRRRCMNQGFDNLLELLAMHHDYYCKTKALTESAEKNPKAPSGTE